ncbi:drug/metabolite exporter family transporter [Psychromonas sp. CNPT3]|uniref:hypothetical protein n=1 Tax=Psychromonas sp. CNPT3 TaxID=314282 RepID=UPI00006E70D3|nr:hypothetical protein [Psychromonas sp. CNPT3]AGH81461.1 drug/metabolite exporter family transporter [Psychromonas sp. CNPT3]
MVMATRLPRSYLAKHGITHDLAFICHSWLWIIFKRKVGVADASFVQPFDHAKLLLNVLGGWLVGFWLGTAGTFMAGSGYYYCIHCVDNSMGMQKVTPQKD